MFSLLNSMNSRCPSPWIGPATRQTIFDALDGKVPFEYPETSVLYYEGLAKAAGAYDVIIRKVPDERLPGYSHLQIIAISLKRSAR